MTDDELGDFEDFGDAPDSSEDSTDDGEEQPEQDAVQIPDEERGSERARLVEENDELRTTLEQIRNPQENPLDLDPRVGVKDLCYDRAKPGAKVYVVASLASSVDAYEQEFPDAPALDEYAGNLVASFTREDAVLACVYVKDSLTNVDTNTTAYPMPESRLTRFPAEEASMVGSAEVEFARTHLPGTPPGANRPTGISVEDHRLGGATPEQVPEDAERDEDGEAVIPDDSGTSSPAGEDMDLSTALACIATHGHTERAEEIREFEGLDSEEVYGL